MPFTKIFQTILENSRAGLGGRKFSSAEIKQSEMQRHIQKGLDENWDHIHQSLEHIHTTAGDTLASTIHENIQSLEATEEEKKAFKDAISYRLYGTAYQEVREQLRKLE